MLAPAILFREELHQLSLMKMYSDEAYYFSAGSSFNSELEVENEADRFQYAILDDDKKVIGYFSYYIDYRNMRAFGLAAMNFSDKPNIIIGLDILREINKLLVNERVHKITWMSSSENPALRSYLRFCFKNNGRFYILKDEYINREGRFSDIYVFDIIKEGVRI